MFILLSHNRSDFVHLLGERFVHNVGVVECHSGIGMTEHLLHILQLYIIRQRDSRSGGIARAICTLSVAPKRPKWVYGTKRKTPYFVEIQRFD